MFFTYANIVAVSKAAIATSDSLKSATSKRVAIGYALAGFSLLLVYGFFDRSKREIDILPIHIATLSLQHSPQVNFIDAVSSIDLRAILRSGKPFTSELARLELTSIDDSGPSGWRLPSIGVRGSQVIFSQAPSGSTWSLLETCLKLLLLFQGITAIINSSLATVFALIAHNRGKVDLKVKDLDLELKRLQIVQLQQQLDKQTRERQEEIETTTSSGIVLII